MASIPLPVATATDQFTIQIEEHCEVLLSRCQMPAGQFDTTGKNAVMKAQLTLLQAALQAWVTALTTQIATL